MNKLTCLTVSFGLAASGCATHRQKVFESALHEQRCEDALNSIPEQDPNVRLVGRASRFAGTALSYTAAGAGYTADVVLTVIGGTVILAVVCGPAIAASIASQGHVENSNACFSPQISSDVFPHMGHDIYKNTESIRCPDLTALAHSIRRVATCQENRKTLVELQNAKVTLNSVALNREFMNCISGDERSALHTDLARVTSELLPSGMLDPDRSIAP